MATQDFFETLRVLHCAQCGVVYGITTDFERRRRADHEGFTCPSGHSNVYRGPSEAERLKAQLEAKERELANSQMWEREATARARRTEKRLSATRGIVTRQKNRAKRGQCPCCSNVFQDLHQHMSKEHPHFDPLQEVDGKEAESTIETTQSVIAKTLRDRVLAALTDKPQSITDIAKTTGGKYSTVAFVLSTTNGGSSSRVSLGKYVRGVQS